MSILEDRNESCWNCAVYNSDDIGERCYEMCPESFCYECDYDYNLCHSMDWCHKLETELND